MRKIGIIVVAALVAAGCTKTLHPSQLAALPKPRTPNLGSALYDTWGYYGSDQHLHYIIYTYNVANLPRTVALRVPTNELALANVMKAPRTKKEICALSPVLDSRGEIVDFRAEETIFEKIRLREGHIRFGQRPDTKEEKEANQPIALGATNNAPLPSVPMNFDELEAHCRRELAETLYSHPALGKAEIIDWKLLAWQRVKQNNSSFYYDSALSWAKVRAQMGVRWALLQNGRNSEYPHWRTSYVFDYPRNTWSVYFDHPPSNRDLYESMSRFEWNPQAGYRIYEGKILADNWLAAIGEKPLKAFQSSRKDGIEPELSR